VSPSRIALALLTASVWPLSCCCEEPECGDDVRDVGELCFEEDRVGVELELDTPLALRIGRFDADERPDLLVIGTDTTGVTGRLLPGGLDELADPNSVTVFGCSAYPIAGDLSDDGRDDLVFATCANGLLVFIASGDDFAAPIELAVGVAVRQAAIADVDGDGRRDLLVLGLDATNTPVLSFLQALPGGAFAPAFMTTVPVPVLADFAPAMMAAARVERDGRFEVVFAEPDRPGALARTHFMGAGTFAPPTPLGLDLRPAGLGLRDLDGDDRLDLVTVDRGRGELAGLLRAGDEFIKSGRTSLGDGWQSFAIGQLDDDGWLDLAVVTDARIALRRGVGDGSFDDGVVVEFPAAVVELALMDLNADGRDDLIAGTFTGKSQLTIALSGP
jgi:hypothetical protein